MSPAKEQKLLPIENVAFKGEITFTERKRCLLTQQRVYRENMYRRKSDNAINGITVLQRRSPMRKCIYWAKTWLTKLKTRLPNENIPRKGENTLTQKQCRSQSWKSVYRANHLHAKAKTLLSNFFRAKSSLAKAKTRFSGESVAPKVESAFTELIHSSQRRKRSPSENVPRKGGS